MYSRLFEPFEVGGLKLRNRLTMAPMYLGYAGEGGSVSNLLLEHYRLMAGSGVAMVVVENATVDYLRGSGASRSIRADTDENLDGLKRLAETIKAGRSLSLFADQPCRTLCRCPGSGCSFCRGDLRSDAQGSDTLRNC